MTALTGSLLIPPLPSPMPPATPPPAGQAPLAELAPIGLVDLVAQASLLTRTDRKYVLPVADLVGIKIQSRSSAG